MIEPTDENVKEAMRLAGITQCDPQRVRNQASHLSPSPMSVLAHARTLAKLRVAVNGLQSLAEWNLEARCILWEIQDEKP